MLRSLTISLHIDGTEATFVQRLALTQYPRLIEQNSTASDMARLPFALSILVLLSPALCDRYPDCVSGPLAANDVCRMGLEPSERAKALVSAMTIEEKLVNMVEYVQ